MIACVSAAPLGQLGRSFSWVIAGKGLRSLGSAVSLFCCLTTEKFQRYSTCELPRTYS